ncbi:MAG: hypothetical protein V7720_14925 [Halioglobus sp.]
MILTIWRHGEAGNAVTDRMRELTSVGQDDIGFGCHQFHDLCSERELPDPELILFSEWVRTAQTAAIIANAFADAATNSWPALIPGSLPREVDAQLDRRMTAGERPEHLLLVSHQPLVSALVDYYLGSVGLVAPLVPGGLAVLEMNVVAQSCASLLFSAQPPQYELRQ